MTDMCQIFKNDTHYPKYLSGGKLKMWTISFLEIKDAKNNKMFNFLIGCFSIMGRPMGMSFGVFSETIVRLLKSIISKFFSEYSKSYNILNAKSCLKYEGS